jgi:hypothetical protein
LGFSSFRDTEHFYAPLTTCGPCDYNFGSLGR